MFQKFQASQIMTTYSPVEHTEKNYIISTTSTTNNYAQRIAVISVNLLNLHRTTELPLAGKEYTFFQNDGETAQSDKCIK